MRNVTKAGSRGKDFRMKFFNTILLVLSVNHIEQGFSLLEVSQGSLLLTVFELRSASCVHIVISVLLSVCICVSIRSPWDM